MNIIVTGSSGFIGFFLAEKLLKLGFNVIGIDNHNNYYDKKLKEDRVNILLRYPRFIDKRIDISNTKDLENIFIEYKPFIVYSLAAQAGVRYSIENPSEYIKSNIAGFYNILELSKKYNIKKIIYASSSSVYGACNVLPYKVGSNTDQPLNLYAATKKSNELMAYSYSNLFDMETVGVRLFTVYGPWGRPDMAIYKFTRSILNGEPIEIYNNGCHLRDFTYIDDIIEGLINLKNYTFEDKAKIYNMGNNTPIDLIKCIEIIENLTGVRAQKIFLPLQKGDMLQTYSDNSLSFKDFNYLPKTSIENGLSKFVSWYKEYSESKT
jgi:UDP-glucuronate 4-epimerase